MTGEGAGAAPLVSVIMPAYNHERYVEEAVRSVLDQTYPAVELIVVDDCSTDRTAEIVAELARQHRFTFERNARNLGVNGAIERGAALARGSFIAILGSDDAIAPNKIEEQVAMLEAKGLDAVYGTGWLLFPDGKTELIDLSDLEGKFADGSVLEHLYADSAHGPLLQSALIRRKAFIELAAERGRFTSDDWVMLIRLIERYRVGFVNRPQFYYRQHDGNTYTNYWKTLPIRVEVISHVTPEPLRARALSNAFRTQAQFLYMDGQGRTALKFLLASIALDPSPGKFIRLLTEIFGRWLKRTFRRLRKGA